MASDNFTAASNPLAAPWATGTGWASLRAVSGECGNASGTDVDSMMRYSASSSLRSIIEYRSGTFDGGPAFMDAAGNGYLSTCFTGTTVQIFDVTAGPNYHQIGGDAAVTFAAGDLAELRIDGNDIVFYKNTVETFRVTSTLFRAGLSPAIFEFAGALRVDNWSDGLIDLLTGLPLSMRPGPGISPSKLYTFGPQRFAATVMLADTSLAALLASGSAVIADLTTSSRLGLTLSPGPGISPNYLTVFSAQRRSAATAPADTSLSATLTSSSSLTAALTTAIPLAATLASVTTLTSALTTAIPLQATLSSASTLTAALSTAIPLAATLSSTSTLSAGLTTAIRLAGTLSSASTLTASLTTAIPFAASLQSVCTLTAQLAGTGAALAATLGSVSTLTASLTTAIPLSAALQSVCTLTAQLAGSGAALAATLSSTSTLTASLTTAIRMQSVLASNSTLIAALTTSIRFAATLGSVSTLTATLGNSAAQLQAALSSTSTLTAGLTTAIRMAATLSSTSTLLATLTGGAAELAAALLSVSTLAANLTSTVRLQPSGDGVYDVLEGQFASRRAPYVSMVAPGPGRLVAGESYGVAIGRFAWMDDGGVVRTIRTGEQRLGFVRQVFGPRGAIYADNGLRWIRQGLPVSLYVRGEFWARFAGGALAGDVVYVSLLDGSPISGYARDALPSQWRVAVSAFPGDLAVITTWE